MFKSTKIKGVLVKQKPRIGVLFTRHEISSKDKKKTVEKDNKKFFM